MSIPAGSAFASQGPSTRCLSMEQTAPEKAKPGSAPATDFATGTAQWMLQLRARVRSAKCVVKLRPSLSWAAAASSRLPSDIVTSHLQQHLTRAARVVIVVAQQASFLGCTHQCQARAECSMHAGTPGGVLAVRARREPGPRQEGPGSRRDAAVGPLQNGQRCGPCNGE